MFTRPRVLVREITAPLPNCLHACFTSEQYLNNKSILNVLHPTDDEVSLKALTCILNSKLMSALYKAYAVKSARKIFPKVVIRNLREFPFPIKLDKNLSSKLAGLYDRIAALRLNEAKISTPHDHEVYRRHTQGIDRQIDQNVFKLFGLSEGESRIIEMALTKQ